MSENKRGRTSFYDEFSSLPNKSPNHDHYFWPQTEPPCHFVPVLTGQDCNTGQLKLLLGKSPTSLREHAPFWQAAIRENVGSIVTPKDSGSGPFGVTGEFGVESQIHTVANYSDTAAYKYGPISVTDSDGKQLQCHNWIFKQWPGVASTLVVPAFPHFFLDFLRSIIAKTYFRRIVDNRPILILFDDTPDIAALTACILVSIQQSCERRAAFVYRCVVDLRRQFQCNVISHFSMYHFIYECILIASSAAPTIMVSDRKDFLEAYNCLFHRPNPPNDGETVRLPQPIVEQFELIKKFSEIYSPKPRNILSRLRRGDVDERRKNMFQPRRFLGIMYWKLPSFELIDHFISIRHPVGKIESLLELMAKYDSRTLFWISDAESNPAEMLPPEMANRAQVSISNVVAREGFYTFEMEAPTEGRALWHVACFQFYRWPADRPTPTRPCRELLATIRAALRHARKSGANGRVVIYEGTSTFWRGAMVALGAYLEQHMVYMSEVDVFRTVQLFKIYDQKAIVASMDQFKWCLKMSWSSLQHHLAAAEISPPQKQQ